MTKAEREAANRKLKEDIAKEEKELGKMMMTKRQRQLYQKADEANKAKKEASKKLIEKKKRITRATAAKK